MGAVGIGGCGEEKSELTPEKNSFRICEDYYSWLAPGTQSEFRVWSIYDVDFRGAFYLFERIIIRIPLHEEDRVYQDDCLFSQHSTQSIPNFIDIYISILMK